MKKAMINYVKNEKCDEIYTPDYAVKPLLKFLPKDAVIWECTDFGGSNITKVLRENGYKVYTTGKEEIDFINETPDFDFDIIVTNPPYTLKDDFLKKCFEYEKPFCLLLPLTSLEGIKRGKLYRKYGMELLVFDKRINFIYRDMKKSNWFNASWFCYKILPEKLMFESLDTN